MTNTWPWRHVPGPPPPSPPPEPPQPPPPPAAFGQRFAGGGSWRPHARSQPPPPPQDPNGTPHNLLISHFDGHDAIRAQQWLILSFVTSHLLQPHTTYLSDHSSVILPSTDVAATHLAWNNGMFRQLGNTKLILWPHTISLVHTSTCMKAALPMYHWRGTPWVSSNCYLTMLSSQIPIPLVIRQPHPIDVGELIESWSCHCLRAIAIFLQHLIIKWFFWDSNHSTQDTTQNPNTVLQTFYHVKKPSTVLKSALCSFPLIGMPYGPTP